MHNSDASRRGNADSYLSVIARSNATKQSSFLPFIAKKKTGLLRGACHRARIRATRWLAMTLTGCLKFESVGWAKAHLRRAHHLQGRELRRRRRLLAVALRQREDFEAVGRDADRMLKLG